MMCIYVICSNTLYIGKTLYTLLMRHFIEKIIILKRFIFMITIRVDKPLRMYLTECLTDYFLDLILYTIHFQ